jgi:ABC-type nitrate/sulfonate/bicarbonate transport system substrate-binding protein
LVLLFALAASSFAQLQKITINYPNRSGSNWPLFIAKEGGYYQKYGLDVTLTFGVHPAGVAALVSDQMQMVNSSMEQLMQAASKDGSLVLMGSSLNKGMFALMAKKEIADVKGLKGKKVAIGQVGDAPYGYMISLMGHYGLKPRDVQWIPVGTDVNGRVAALTGGRADATLLTAPAYFRVEEQGYKTLANLSEHDDVFASTAYLFKKSLVKADPKLPEKIIQAHAEAIKRFYEDKAFAVKAFLAYDKAATAADTERVYELYNKPQAFERVPYVLAPAVKSVLAQQADPNIAAQMKAYDWKQVIDNSVVESLVKQGFFEKLYGDSIKAEEQRKAKLAFRK